MTDQSTDIAHPEIRRMRHELKRRSLTVERVERLTPHMIRVHLTGADLAGFVSAAFDDHLKVFLPRDGAEPDRRDYTPRRYDAAANRLLLDFVDHDAGPAAEWARGAQAGDTLEIAGPRGSAVIAGDIAQWLLIGDETALPAIGRQVEELRQGPRVTSIVAVPGPADEQRFESAAEHRALWLHRPAAQATDPPLSRGARRDRHRTGHLRLDRRRGRRRPRHPRPPDRARPSAQLAQGRGAGSPDRPTPRTSRSKADPQATSPRVANRGARLGRARQAQSDTTGGAVTCASGSSVLAMSGASCPGA
ncbi:siderophore-interacting protein [Seohaeicola zhoushanensis]